ncbi:MAG: N-acetylmuramoyl-L-alanine amidase [Bacilli bacterium]|nr:N-acetylmuramoyl-L-alanine amidase [Bacilli bacterium]
MRKTSFLIFLLLLILTITGCGGNPSTKKNLAEELLNAITVDAEFSPSFVLPETVGESATPITWESSDPDVLAPEGYSYIQTEDKTVTMRATIEVEGEKHSKEFEVLVKADTEGLFDIAWEYYGPKLKSSTVKDLKLVTSNYGEFSVMYKSLNEEIITSEGVVNQTNEDQVVTFEVTIIKGNERKVFTKDITLAKYTDAQLVKKVMSWAEEQTALFQEGLITQLPSTHPTLGATISWSSSVPGTISPEGVLIRPVDKVSCTFTYHVISGDASLQNAFTIDDFGGASEEEFLNLWLSTIMPTKIIAHKNIVYDQYGTGELFLKEQYATYDGAVLNLIDGKSPFLKQDYFIDVTKPGLVEHWTSATHPAISTDPNNSNLKAVYEHFYEGYVIPNEENILWIVVHESGMPGEGNNAELLAKIQYDRAYGNRPYSPASWNYQVDHEGIYQSFDDEVYCWHAGGDYGKWLPYRNSNSIGIEMCINQDGNYDGAMHQDAKLIAYLMHKYNLTFDNVVRHHDTSGKECPSYMLRTDRYNEFLQMVAKEYVAMKYLADAEVTWTVSNPELFESVANGLMYAKPVSKATDVTVTLKVVKGTYVFEQSSTFTLYPSGEKK